MSHEFPIEPDEYPEPTIAQPSSILRRILDGDLGARARAMLLLAMAVVTAVLALLQEFAEVLESVPGAGVGRVLLWVQAGIVFLARFTNLGDVKP